MNDNEKMYLFIAINFFLKEFSILIQYDLLEKQTITAFNILTNDVIIVKEVNEFYTSLEETVDFVTKYVEEKLNKENQ